MKMRICSKCRKPIIDRYVCQISKDDRFFHWNCLRCDSCGTVLNDHCHVKNGNIFCKSDYIRLCTTVRAYSCQGCLNQIDNNKDWVVKIPSCSNTPSPPNQSPFGNSPNATSYVLYHLRCIQCSYCKKNLNPGDRYVLNRQSQSLVCMASPCIASYTSQIPPHSPYGSSMPNSPYPSNQPTGPPVAMPVGTGTGRGKRGGRNGNGCRKQN